MAYSEFSVKFRSETQKHHSGSYGKWGVNDQKIVHTRQRKAPLRGARLCYRTAHTCKETPTAWRQHHAKRSSSSWRAMQLNHAACMSAGTCAATAEAGRAWLSRQEQQEDELRTTGGRWPMLAFWILVLGELSLMS